MTVIAGDDVLDCDAASALSLLVSVGASVDEFVERSENEFESESVTEADVLHELVGNSEYVDEGVSSIDGDPVWVGASVRVGVRRKLIDILGVGFENVTLYVLVDVTSPWLSESLKLRLSDVSLELEAVSTRALVLLLLSTVRVAERCCERLRDPLGVPDDDLLSERMSDMV